MSDQIMRNLLSQSQEDQARICATFFRRGCPYGEAARWARRACMQIGPTLATHYLSQHGIALEVSSAPATIGNVTVRARLEEGTRLVVFEKSLLELRDAAEYFGVPLPVDLSELVLAHEIFHHLCPTCPAHLAETAAHAFVSMFLKLPFFAAVLDLAAVLYRKALRITTTTEAGASLSW